MDKNQRPHSREKSVGSGSADVGKGQKVETGSRPVGAGGRREQGTGPRRVYQTTGSTGGGGQPVRSFGMKPIVLIIIAVIAIFVISRMMGGNSNDDPNTSWTQQQPSSWTQQSTASWTQQSTASSSASGADTSVSPEARDKRVTPKGGGRDTVTVMVYMCGTDLESKYGMATSDLQEMIDAKISDKVNVIVLTGGCSKWKNNIVSNKYNQIYKVEDEGLSCLVDNFGTDSMTNPKNLTKFINYCTKNYPADRNMLIFWDHGGGTISGYGYDEKDTSNSSMTLSKINSALDEANCVFDWIGYDACLMATLETALVCGEYADYLIASEETEPGTGWDYSGWLTALSNNTSLATVDTAKIIIDDFVSASTRAQSGAKVTLSVTDLAELDGTVPTAFTEFAKSTNELIENDDYKQVADARAGVRQFSQSSKINQVDLVDLAERIGTAESKDLAKTIKNCVKYNKSTITRCNGVSIYFPYETTKNVKSAVASYNDLGLDSEYTKCIQSFASLEYGGQIAGAASQGSYSSGGDLLGTLMSAYSQSGSSTSPISALLGGFTSGGSSSAGMSIDPSMLISLLGGFSGRSMPAEYDWVDTDLISAQAENIVDYYLDPANLKATTKNGRDVLVLSDEEWALIETVELNVFVDDGDGYIDLGYDNTFEWLGDDMLLEYDGTWLTINGNVCAYYLVSDTENADGSWTTVGRIPAKLNGQLVNLQVVFDGENPAGTVTGAYPMYEDVDVFAKGDIEIKAGDEIVLLCDYYDLDGNYSASYTLGKKFTVPQSGLTLTNLRLNTQDVSVTYRFTDIYGNHYWLPLD